MTDGGLQLQAEKGLAVSLWRSSEAEVRWSRRLVRCYIMLERTVEQTAAQGPWRRRKHDQLVRFRRRLWAWAKEEK